MNSHKKTIIDKALLMKYGGMHSDELEFLYEICQNKTVLELGSMVGMSSYVIASVAKELDCIDTWDDSFKHLAHDSLQLFAYHETWISRHNNNPPNMLETFKDNCKEYIDSKKIKIIQGKTSDVANSIDKKYDIVFVDADHSYDGVKQDINNYIDKIKTNGTMIFHDYGGSWWPGVDKAVDESINDNLLTKCFDYKNNWLIRSIAVCIKNK